MSPDKVKATCVVSLPKIVQDVAALHLYIFIYLYLSTIRIYLGVKNAHGLSKVMSFHNTSFAAVKSRQDRVGRYL